MKGRTMLLVPAMFAALLLAAAATLPATREPPPGAVSAGFVAADTIVATSVAADPYADRVDALFAPWTEPGSPGAAVGVVRDGELVLARGYGLANLEYDIPISSTTVFHIASISKHFTAFAIGLLAAEGRLSLNDDVRQHLPEVPDFGRTITLRHLIHHTSGLRDQWELLAMAGWRLDDVITREHILTMVAHQRALNFEPGAEYLYSNTGYTLLAEIVARVSGQSFAQFTEERVFRPLGMEHTHFHDDHQRLVPNRAYSYAPSGSGWMSMPLNYANVGATSLFTTVADLATWERNFRTAGVGGATLLQEMLTPGVLNNGETIAYAHALMLGEYRGLSTVSHSGADAGYRTAYLRFPDQGFAVIVFSNLSTFNPVRLAQQVAEVYLGDLMQPERPRRAQRPPRAERAVRLSERELAARAGLFANPANDQLRRIEFRSGRLVLAHGPGYELRPLDPQRFVAVGTQVAVELTFEYEAGSSAPARLREVVDSGEPAVYLPVAEVPVAQLAAFAGTYYSEELGTTYRLQVRGGRLVAEHRRHTETQLIPTLPDRFIGESWWFRRLVFTRDRTGAVDGFQLTGGRVRDLRFTRLGD
jgi:CubicO group peptidase (beta-lactamase class C family)